jgi:hypothetical protein
MSLPVKDSMVETFPVISMVWLSLLVKDSIVETSSEEIVGAVVSSCKR